MMEWEAAGVGEDEPRARALNDLRAVIHGQVSLSEWIAGVKSMCEDTEQR